MGSDSLASGGGQMLELLFELEKEQLYAPGILLFSLTCTLLPNGFLQGVDQGELALVAERACEVIQVNGRDHGTSKIVLLKPLSLLKDRGCQRSFYFPGLRAGPAACQRG